MPANVDSMFSVRQMPWHREGTVLPEYPGSWDEARILAGLDWEPVFKPVWDMVDSPEGYRYEPIPEFRQIVRSDTGKRLSIRPDSYALINHQEMGGIVEAVLGQPNVRWETAGSLNGGRAVWCLCVLDEPVQIPGDDSMTLPYLGVTNRHDGTGACTLRTTAVRIVCANTFGAAEAEGERTGTTFSFVHRGNWREHLEEATEAVMKARQQFSSYVNLATGLTEIPVTAGQRELFIQEFIRTPPEGLITNLVARNIEESRNALRGIFASQTIGQDASNAYWLVQGAGEYLDHVRRARTWETKLGRTIIRPEPLKQRAIKLAQQVATIDA